MVIQAHRLLSKCKQAYTILFFSLHAQCMFGTPTPNTNLKCVL